MVVYNNNKNLFLPYYRFISKISWGGIIVAYAISNNQVLCQTTNLYPSSYSLSPTMLVLIHPGALGMNGNTEISINNLNNTGAFSKVRSFSGYGSFRLSNKEKNSHGNLGATLCNESEGNYIQRPRAYLNYSWHTKLSSAFSAGAGIAAGILNYSFSASDVSAGGSATGPDAAVGLWLENDKIKLGFSISQVFNSKITPIDIPFRFPRFYSAFASYKIVLLEKLFLNPFFLLTIKPQSPYSNYDSGFLFNISDFVAIGPSFRSQRSLSFLVSFYQISLSDTDFLSLKFAYNHPVITVFQANTPSFEISLGFSRKKVDVEKEEVEEE